MSQDVFYRNNKMTAPLEWAIRSCQSYDEFETRFSDEFLNEDCRAGQFLSELLYKYDKKASVISVEAGLNHSYVGNIINGKKNNPSRNVLLSICLVIGVTVEEAQYLLKYVGLAPLYVRKRRDVIIWYGLTKGESLDVVNDNLLARGLSPLYTEK